MIVICFFHNIAKQCVGKFPHFCPITSPSWYPNNFPFLSLARCPGPPALNESAANVRPHSRSETDVKMLTERTQRPLSENVGGATVSGACTVWSGSLSGRRVVSSDTAPPRWAPSGAGSAELPRGLAAGSVLSPAFRKVYASSKAQVLREHNRSD